MDLKFFDENMSEKNNIKIMVHSSKSVATHYHKFLELVYVLKGSAVHIFNETEKQIISEGDFFIIDYKTNHSYKSVGNRNFSVINCLFLPSFIDKSLIYCRDFQTLLRHYLLGIGNEYSKIHLTDRIFCDCNGKIKEILSQMLKEYETENMGYLEILRLKLMEILIETARMQSFSKSTDVIFDITERMHREYNKSITLGMYAKEFNYSLPYLSRLFTEKTGLHFKNYLKKIRIDEACRLLINTNEKIHIVSDLVGYNDVDFFSKIFKESTGLAPGAFRKKFTK